MRQRRTKNRQVLPRFDFDVNEFKDDHGQTASNSGQNGLENEQPQMNSASFPNGISNPHSDQWRRPASSAKANLVENMEFNK